MNEWKPEFQSFGHAGKVMCTTCGRTGYPGGRWQEKCRQPHIFKCACGKAYATLQQRAGHIRKSDSIEHRAIR